MATNPLFSSISKKSFTPLKHRHKSTYIRNEQIVKNLTSHCIAQLKRPSLTTMAAEGCGPPEKRRKTEQIPGDELWGDEDDDFFYSQCAIQLDKVEHSQETSKEQNNNRGKVITPKVSNCDTVGSSFRDLHPQRSVLGTVTKNSLLNMEQTGGFDGGHPTGSDLGVKINKLRTVGVKSNHGYTPHDTKSQGYHSMQTWTPSVLCNSDSNNDKRCGVTTSVPCNSDSNNGQRRGVERGNNMAVTHSMGSSHKKNNDMNNSQFSGVVQQKLCKIEEENSLLKTENKTLKDSQYGTDGLIKNLRTKVAQLEAERHRDKHEKMLQKEKEGKEQSLKEKQLQQDYDKLKSNLQFRERDLNELQERCRTLEKQFKVGDVAGSPLRTQIFTSPGRSPCTKRGDARSPNSTNTQKVESPSTPRSSHFPTKRSFLETEVSPKGRKPLGPELETFARPAGTSTITETQVRKSKRKMKLEVNHAKGQISGPQLVSRLFDGDAYGSNHSPTHPGIIGLLQNSVPLPARLDRDSHSTGLTPLSRPTTTGSSSSGSIDAIDLKYIVKKDKIKLAQQAISALLTSPCNTIPPSCDMNNAQQAVLMLPMIENYLHIYINIMQNIKDPILNESCDTTNSPSSSLLSQDGASSYLNGLENQTLSALAVLDTLTTYCKYIGCLLVVNKDLLVEGDTVTKTSDEIHLPNVCEQVTEEDITNRVLQGLDSNTVKVLKNCDIMTKLCKLANPLAFHEKMYNSAICSSSLKLLTVITQACTLEGLERLSHVLSAECLSNCFKDIDLVTEQQLIISTHAMSLITAMVRSPLILQQLCSQDENCILQSMYNTCLVTAERAPQSYRLALCHQLFALICSILTTHEHSPAQMFESDCLCNQQIVKCVTVAIHRELNENSKCKDVLSLLRVGLSTLFLISCKDRLFTRHHEKECKHEFMETVCTLQKLLKTIPDVTELEIILVYELWDFEQDQSSEDEINMDLINQADSSHVMMLDDD